MSDARIIEKLGALNLSDKTNITTSPEDNLTKENASTKANLGFSVSYKIPYNEIHFGERIPGYGAMSGIYKGTWHEQKIVLKILDDKHLINPKNIKALMNEMEMLSYIRSLKSVCPYIVRSYECVMEDANIPIVMMEYATNGTVGDLALNKKNSTLLSQHRYKIISQIANGIAFLHQHNIFHLDIKPDNILLDKNMDARICDFGFAVRCDSEVLNSKGTPGYMPPEVVQLKPCTKKSDIFSFGVTLFEIMARHQFLHEITNTRELMFAVSHNKRSKIPSSCPEEMAKLIEDCWQQDPALRPSADAVVARIEAMQKR